MHLFKFLFSLLIINAMIISKLCAQEIEISETESSNENRGWIFGLNVGVYYPSGFSANYYNGSPENENNAKFITDNYYRYNELFEAMNANDTISIYGFPENMHYKLALNPGIYTQFCFNSSLALMLEFNYMKLKANDVLIFEVDPKEYATEPDLRLFPLRGVEERIYANIGLRRDFVRKKNLSYFATGGININSTQVKKCSFYVDEKEYSMINNLIGNYVPGGNYQTTSIYQGGIGYGLFASGGLSFRFPMGVIAEPSININFVRVNLEQYKQFKPGFGIFTRFLF
jgi:hypothetical protein